MAGEEKKEKLEEHLSKIKIGQEEKVAEEKAKTTGFPYFNLAGLPIAPEVLVLMPEEEAVKFQALCFFKIGKEVRLGAVNPKAAEIAELKSRLEKEHQVTVQVYLISQHSFNSALKLYKTIPKIREIIKGVKISQAELEKYQVKIKTFKDLNKAVQGVAVTDVVTLIIAASIPSRASDIHIEAEEKDVKVRFRIDGILIDVAKLEKKVWPQVVNRIKLLSSLKINITDRPQDGRFTIYLAEDKIDVRVSCLPTAFGESIVMRLLRSSAASLAFKELGLRDKSFEQLRREVERPNGMIVTTGPTGSGKTTTLYAILNKLNKPETKIITLEDPIEYRLEGINQSQVQHEKGYTFAKGLRSILRQDPDVVMVGEIRDLETAEISIQAALTGHLVVSTLHTNDAAGAIPRFLSMGAKPFLLAPALNAVIGQRLVRRICKECKEEVKLDAETLSRVRKLLSELSEKYKAKIDFDKMKFYHGKGCDKCQSIGYKGRVGIYEVFTMTPEIEKVILSGSVSEYQMKEVAIKAGMITMVQDGLIKALDGVTTVEEVFRVIE